MWMLLSMGIRYLISVYLTNCSLEHRHGRHILKKHKVNLSVEILCGKSLKVADDWNYSLITILALGCQVIGHLGLVSWSLVSIDWLVFSITGCLQVFTLLVPISTLFFDWCSFSWSCSFYNNFPGEVHKLLHTVQRQLISSFVLITTWCGRRTLSAMSNSSIENVLLSCHMTTVTWQPSMVTSEKW
jgi:hypothetical protein